MAIKIIKAIAVPVYLPDLSLVKGRRTCVSNSGAEVTTVGKWRLRLPLAGPGGARIVRRAIYTDFAATEVLRCWGCESANEVGGAGNALAVVLGCAVPSGAVESFDGALASRKNSVCRWIEVPEATRPQGRSSMEIQALQGCGWSANAELIRRAATRVREPVE